MFTAQYQQFRKTNNLCLCPINRNSLTFAASGLWSQIMFLIIQGSIGKTISVQVLYSKQFSFYKFLFRNIRQIFAAKSLGGRDTGLFGHRQ